MYELEELDRKKSIIKVIGIGGGGGNTIKYMIKSKVINELKNEIEYLFLNTKKKAFNNDLPYNSLQLGIDITKGIGTGGDQEKGRLAALEQKENIKNIIGKTDMLFITTGLGGGTGTGAIPVIAEIAKKMGILTIAVVTKPFTFEGQKRMQIAEKGIYSLKQHVDSLIVIPNDKLSSTLGKNTSLLNAFDKVNNVLLNAVDGISELIIKPGFINIDFADVKSVMSNQGIAVIGMGQAGGDNRAKTAFERAIYSPLLENVKISGANGVLVNISCGSDLSIFEFNEIGELVKNLSSKEANVIVGTVLDETMKGEMRITIVAAGLSDKKNIIHLVTN